MPAKSECMVDENYGDACIHYITTTLGEITIYRYRLYASTIPVDIDILLNHSSPNILIQITEVSLLSYPPHFT